MTRVFLLLLCSTASSFFHRSIRPTRPPSTSSIGSTANNNDDLSITNINNDVNRQAVKFVRRSALLLTSTAVASQAIRTTAKEIDSMIDLGKRVKSKDAQMLPRGVIQAPDVYYPVFFSGLWKISSIATGFDTPLGEALFGGKAAIRAVQRDMNESLVYRSKFDTLPDGRVIADRVYNVKSIAVASMGEESIIDEAQPDTDVARRLHLGVAPTKDAGNLFDIDLIAVRYNQTVTP